MARVAVLHNTLDFQGGADAVCLAACEALAGTHDVTLFTVSETTPAALADRFGATVGDVDVRMPPGATAVARALSKAAPWVGPQIAFRSAVLGRAFRPSAAAFDLAVSTTNELAVPLPSVQYVHHPQFRRHRRPGADAGRPNRLWSRLAAPDDGDLAGDGVSLLANSSWTADAVADVYGVRPGVLHPPVDPIPGGRAWADREDGLVTVGRLAPDKRALDAVAVVDRLRRRGHDLHLHVVGVAPRAYRRYAARVADAADERPYVSLHRDASREQLERLLRTHKYGLNLKPAEPFGMAVAEYVAAGMVAFAPASGGQREVLDGRPDRLFDSLDGAVSLVARAVEADDPPTLPPDRFARDRFKAAIRRHVGRALDSR
jgi:glycosyltransferase involved in cell wall biosynthesis